MQIRSGLRHYPEFQEISVIEIWPKEVEMVPREKFQEDSQKAAKSKKSTGFAWTQKNCSGLSFTI